MTVTEAVLGFQSEVAVVTRLASGTGKNGPWATITLKAARWGESPVPPQEYRALPDVASRLNEGDLVEVAVDMRTFLTTRNGFARQQLDPFIIAAKLVDAGSPAKAA